VGESARHRNVDLFSGDICAAVRLKSAIIVTITANSMAAWPMV
jgi:hypothetical protein